MQLAYIVTTSLAVLANGYAAFASLVGAEFVKLTADRVEVSQRWMAPFGILLGLGALGLLVGFAVPLVGIAAGIGLVAYFICALSAHIRVRDTGVAGAVIFLALAALALSTDLAYRKH